MHHAAKTVHVFVVGVDDSEKDPAARPSRCAYGIFYDNTRFSTYDSSFCPCSLPREVVGSGLAVEHGILSVVDHGPPYVNLVIETDESLTVSAIKYDLITMEKNKNAAAQTKEKGFASVYDRIGRIIDLIEYRLKDGNYFVDIIDSYRDPTAKEGLRRARNLALEALNKDASSPPARQNA